MTNILQTLVVAATLITVTVAASSLVLANSPYPEHFKNPNLPPPSVGAGSGIPAPYRLGDEPAHFKKPNLPPASVGAASGIPAPYRLGN